MRRNLLTALLVGAALAGCAPYAGPVANCFSLVEGEGPCDFRPLPGATEGSDGSS
jgi:hypothetical protein